MIINQQKLAEAQKYFERQMKLCGAMDYMALGMYTLCEALKADPDEVAKRLQEDAEISNRISGDVQQREEDGNG